MSWLRPSNSSGSDRGPSGPSKRYSRSTRTIGIRFPGTNAFGYYIAGTYWKFWDTPRVRSFWVRRHAEKCITLQLRGHHYDVICVEVDDPEAQVEHIRHAIAELFTNGTDSVDLIKWKDVYSLLEDTIDSCEDVANVIERIVVKHA